MSHLIRMKPDHYVPIGKCKICGSVGRVSCLGEFYDLQFCHNCCGTHNPTAERIAELAQSIQRHDVLRYVESFKPLLVQPNGDVSTYDTTK